MKCNNVMTIYIARNSVYEDDLSAYKHKQTYIQCIKNKKWLQGWNKAGHEVSFNKSFERV